MVKQCIDPKPLAMLGFPSISDTGPLILIPALDASDKKWNTKHYPKKDQNHQEAYGIWMSRSSTSPYLY
jgi:hypothetical protein